MAETIRIGVPQYVGAWPLVEGLAAEEGVALRLGPPSAMAGLLKDGSVEAALLPSIEYYRLASDAGERARLGGPAGRAPSHFVALPVAAIGSRGQVGSVRLFGYTERERIRRVLLAPADPTAIALARLLLRRPGPVQAHFVFPDEGAGGPGGAGLLTPSPRTPARSPDAELVVGDAALVAERPKAAWVEDLGEEWDERVHKPLVYAFWAARSDAPLPRLVELLSAARDRGMAAREALAARAVAERGLPPDVARRHLCHQVRYAFGEKERQGLGAFYGMAVEEGLAPEGGRLRFPPQFAS